jgi:hypothetical protein
VNEKWDDRHSSKVMSGSIFVNATQGAAALLKCWGQECIDSFLNPERAQEVWDQVALRDVILRGVRGAEVGALPWGYVTIVGNPNDEKEISDVVIAHYQASRRFKKIINEAG